MSKGSEDCLPFSTELGSTTAEVTAPRSSSQLDGAVDFDSTSSVDSSTERATAIPMSPRIGSRMDQLRLADNSRADSRSSNDSMPPATPTPPNSCNSSPKTRQQSAISRDSDRSLTPNEDRNPSTDRSSFHVSASSMACPLKVTVSQPPQTPPAETASNEKPEYEIKCCCKSQPLIFVHNVELHLMIQGSANENDTLNNYNLVHKMENTKSISKTQVVGHATCKVFFHSNKVTLLSGQFDDMTSTWKLRLYQCDTPKTLSTVHLSWKQVSRFSNLQLNLKNSIPVSYEKDGIILTSVLQYQENRQTITSLVIYMLSQSKGSEKSSEKNWKAIKLRLRGTKYEIQSCVVTLNFLCCSLLHEGSNYIYQCDLALFQKQKQTQFIESISYLPCCHLKDPSIFLSVHKTQVIVIIPNIDCNKTNIEIKQLLNPSTISPATYRFEFSCLVKIVNASVVPDVQDLEIVVVYHNNKTNSCHINRIIPIRLV